MRRETALDQLEEMAYDAAIRMQKAVEAGEVPVTPVYLASIEKAHRMITSGLKANPLDEENLEDEELLLRLVETTDRLRRKIQRKQELERADRPLARLKDRADDDIELPDGKGLDS